MDPQKARELLNLYEHASSSVPRDDFLDAIKVGVQAITYVERLCAMSLEIRKGWHRLRNPIIDTHRSLHTIKRILESPSGRESGQ